MKEILTIGYEGLDLQRFMALLAAHEAQTVVDIREVPLSRKPGFSKKALAAQLQSAGFRYIHLVELGCPKPVRDQHRQDGDWSRYIEGFTRHLRAQRGKLEELASLAEQSRCALLCFEADYTQCHRSLVAEAMRHEYGLTPFHILAKKAEAHPDLFG